MDDGLARWLGIREPSDRAARCEALTRAAAAEIRARCGEPLQLVDLGTGTGSNIRYLAERLGGHQHWLAVDRDPHVLEALPRRMAAWAEARGCDARWDRRRCIVRGADLLCEIEVEQRDLSALGDPSLFAGRHLVTASALLDLVSTWWLTALARHCAAAGAVALFAITYDGWFTCSPPEPEDRMIRDLMNRHQQTDKGFGGASAGPDAVPVTESCFAKAGYRVLRDSSDWRLGAADRDIQRLLIEGWADAALAIAPERADAIMRWQARRLAHLDAGRSYAVVGHHDVAAWPAAAGV